MSPLEHDAVVKALQSMADAARELVREATLELAELRARHEEFPRALWGIKVALNNIVSELGRHS